MKPEKPQTPAPAGYRPLRFLLLLLACAMVGTAGLYHFSTMTGYSLPSTTLELAQEIIRHPIPLNTFQLNETDHIKLEFFHNHGKKPTWSGVAMEKRADEHWDDNLRWHSGSAVEKHHKRLEWYNYSQTGTRQSTPQKRMLIAQYSNKDVYADIFELTKPINMAYAKRWGHDIVFLNGQNKTQENNNLPALLQLAYEARDRYDVCLLMDGDAAMNLHKVDVSDLIVAKEMALAQRIEGSDEEHTWRVFSTVSLWNLHHMLTPRVERAWSDRYKESSPLISLAEQIKPYAETEVSTVTGEIGHDDSSYIKALQFATKTHGFRNVDPAVRLRRWREQMVDVCKKNRLGCKDGNPLQASSQVPTRRLRAGK